MGPLDDHHKGDPFGVRDRRGRLVLDADAAAEMNAINAELRRLDLVAVAAPLEYASDAAGRRWRVGTRRPSIYAKLSGTGSPYTWAEATRSAAGVSSLVTGGRTGTAYEANAVSGLAGKYATLDWTPAGDWRFQATRAGGGSTTTHGAGCTSFCGSMPLSITITPQAGTSTTVYNVTTTLTFQASGPAGDPGAGSAYTAAFGNASNCWWSTLISDGPGTGGYYWVFNCGSYPDSRQTPLTGSFNLGLVHRISGTTTTYVAGYDYTFNGTSSCSPFLATGAAQTISTGTPGTQQWVASG